MHKHKQKCLFLFCYFSHFCFFCFFFNSFLSPSLSFSLVDSFFIFILLFIQCISFAYKMKFNAKTINSNNNNNQKEKKNAKHCNKFKHFGILLFFVFFFSSPKKNDFHFGLFLFFGFFFCLLLLYKILLIEMCFTFENDKSTIESQEK